MRANVGDAPGQPYNSLLEARLRNVTCHCTVQLLVALSTPTAQHQQPAHSCYTVLEWTSFQSMSRRCPASVGEWRRRNTASPWQEHFAQLYESGLWTQYPISILRSCLNLRLENAAGHFFALLAFTTALALGPMRMQTFDVDTANRESRRLVRRPGSLDRPLDVRFTRNALRAHACAPRRDLREMAAPARARRDGRKYC